MCYKYQIYFQTVLEISDSFTTIKFHSFLFSGFWKLRFLVFNKDTQVNTCIAKVIGLLKI